MPDRDARSFAARLKQARIAVAMTQETLASRSGVSVRAISDLERGVSGAPRVDTMMLLADALGLDGPERREFFSRGQPGAGIRVRGAEGPVDQGAPPSQSRGQGLHVRGPRRISEDQKGRKPLSAAAAPS